MTNDVKHLAAMELVCTMILTELADVIPIAIEALQSDCDIDEHEAKTLILGYFQSFIAKYPTHAHKPDYAAIYWRLEVSQDTCGYTPKDDDDNDLPYGNVA